MRWHSLQLALVLAGAFCPWMALAQNEPPVEQPADNPVQEPAEKQPQQSSQILRENARFTQTFDDKWNLSEIHSYKTVGASRQCTSCHAAAHNPRVNQLLLATNTVPNPLGIETLQLDAPLRLHLNVNEKSGLVVSAVPEGSEGSKLGLKAHDILLGIDEQEVKESELFNRLVQDLQGKKVRLRIVRQGKPQSIEATIPKVPQAAAFLELAIAQNDHFAWADNRYRMGVTLSEADDTLRSHLKLASGEGLVVTEVVDGSPASKMGVKQHDVLTELDGKRLTTVDAINAHIQELKDKTVVLKLLRSGQEVTCQIAAKKSSEPSATWMETVLVEDRNHHPAIVKWFNAIDRNSEPSNLDAATQLAELKKQLAELGKTVEKLEALVAPAAPAEQKKPEEGPEKK